MASAAGFASHIDPLLLQSIQALPKQEFDDEYLCACLLMVFVAVTIPKLARSESSLFKVRCRILCSLVPYQISQKPLLSSQAQLDGHENNIHCLAVAVNQIFGVLFTLCGQDDIEDRLKEFLVSHLSQFPGNLGFV
jgi:NCK-associated protein 1